MGEIVMVIGKSGSGKSTSLRNFNDGEVGVLNVAGKRLPFKGKLPTMNRPSYDDCEKLLTDNSYNAYIIDDSTYLMQLENFDRATEKGYDKFTQMAQNFEHLLLTAVGDTSDDTLVYFLHHPQFGDDGSIKPQTIGKMLDNQLCIEGLFPIILECEVKDGIHGFFTNNHGLAKTPIDMFREDFISNDLAVVDKAIRDYWKLAPLKKGGK